MTKAGPQKVEVDEVPMHVPAGAPGGGVSKGRRALRFAGDWSLVGLLGGAVLLVVYLFRLFLDRASNEADPLSNLEQTFFGTFTLFVGAGLSWVVSHHYARRETRVQFERLARPALRRVVAARASADGLRAAVDRRQYELADDASEAFESMRELVDQHARTLDDAIADWQELLPREVGELYREAAYAAQARHEATVKELSGRLDVIESAEGSDDSRAKVEALRRDVDRLDGEVQRRVSSGTLKAFMGESLYPQIVSPGTLVTSSLPFSATTLKTYPHTTILPTTPAPVEDARDE